MGIGDKWEHDRWHETQFISSSYQWWIIERYCHLLSSREIRIGRFEEIGLKKTRVKWVPVIYLNITPNFWREWLTDSATECSTVLNSAQYAYAHTPDSDSKLRAHYLALIIRSRSIFKRSPAMQKQMYAGGSQLFFDLFVALSNHADDIAKSP